MTHRRLLLRLSCALGASLSAFVSASLSVSSFGLSLDPDFLCAPLFAEGREEVEASYVAVIELKNQAGLSSQEVSYLTELMRQAAQYLPVERYPLITKDNIFTLLPPGTKIEDCQGECAVETGRKIGATWLLTGEVMLIGEQLRVVVQLYHTPSNVMKGSELIKGTTSKPSERVGELENALIAATMRLLSPLDPSLLSKSKRIEGGFVFKRVPLGQLPDLPQEDLLSVEGGFNAVPLASSKVKSVNFEKVNVEALEAYERAVKIERDTSTSPEVKLSAWEQVARDPQLREVATPQVEKWRGFIKKREAIKVRRARALTELQALQKADAQASIKRFQERQAAWAKLKRLLNLSVIERDDKLSWVEAFLDAYGATPELNPHVKDALLKPFLEDPALRDKLPQLQEESRATLKAQKARSLELSRRLCELTEGSSWEEGRCVSHKIRDACLADQRRWVGGACLESEQSCAQRGLVLRGEGCGKSDAELAREEAARAQTKAQQAAQRLAAQYAKRRGERRLNRLNLTDERERYVLSLGGDSELKDQLLSIDAYGVLGQLGLSFNLSQSPEQTLLSTVSVETRAQSKGDLFVGFGVHVPLASELNSSEWGALQEAKRLMAYRERWRWDAHRWSVTLPMVLSKPLSHPGWELDLEFTPVFAFSSDLTPPSALSNSKEGAFSALEHSGFEPYVQTSVGLSRQLFTDKSQVGLRYQAYLSPFASNAQAHGAWAPHLNLQLFESFGLTFEAYLQPSTPSLAAFKNLDEMSARVSLWLTPERSERSSKLCETLIYIGAPTIGAYTLYKSITSFIDALDQGEDEGEAITYFILGYVGTLSLTPTLMLTAEDICE